MDLPSCGVITGGSVAPSLFHLCAGVVCQDLTQADPQVSFTDPNDVVIQLCLVQLCLRVWVCQKTCYNSLHRNACVDACGPPKTDLSHFISNWGFLGEKSFFTYVFGQISIKPSPVR